MLILPVDLKSKTSYKNSGTFFSRAVLAKQFFKQHNALLLITSEDKNIERYVKIAHYLQCNISKLYFYNDLVNLLLNNTGCYVMTPDVYGMPLPESKQIEYHSLGIHINQEISVEQILGHLNGIGYCFSDFRTAGSYKKAGDIVHVISPCGNYEYTLSFWGDVIDSIEISEIFHDLIRNTRKVEKLYIGGCDELMGLSGKSTLGKCFESSSISVIADHINFSKCYESLCKNTENVVSFDIIKNELFPSHNLEIDAPRIKNLEDFKEILSSGVDVHIYTKNYDTIDNFLQYNNFTHIALNKVKISVLGSFKIDKIVVICDDILSRVFIKKRIRKNFSADMDLLMKIVVGDYVVHIDHGIGIFSGIINKKLQNFTKEYIEIEYKGNEKLFVPITEVARVSKYVGVEHPKLTGLGGKIWERQMNSAKQDATKIAAELLEIYSSRQGSLGFSFITHPDKQSEFINSFEYIYTNDQAEAVEELLDEMSGKHPMDRLLIGDVGFGKTEVAFNAIYNAYLNNKQSILITPLVVLAYEHYEKALERFADFGLKIGVLTRFESVKRSGQVLHALEKGEIDLVVGTHKLLSEKIKYKDLGLLIVDEEHKFGVSDKEQIKKIKSRIDVLTMSATPIPRSLNMALSGIRTSSSLKTPPAGRKDIETSVLKFNENIILEACQKEFERGGQVFFIHNRVSNIEHMKKLLLNLFPDKKVAITHGQLGGDLLEKRIIDFKHRKYDILLSTTVIENGIDFANVNTIFINEAQRFGISQIHQLRGRVGRSDRRGYCYLLFKHENLKDDSAKRLQTIVEFSYLGAGFELAMKDLEVRGGGDLLGIRQSGQKTDIGVNLFLKMVEQKVEDMKQGLDSTMTGDKQDEKRETNIIFPMCKIDLNIEVALPDKLFASSLDKINFYREVESIDHLEDLKEVQKDFLENPDISTTNFFMLLKVKILARKFQVTSIKKTGIHYQIDLQESAKIEDMQKMLACDAEGLLSVVDITRARTPIKNFENPTKFLQYLLLLFEKKAQNPKIKIKKK